MPARARRAAAEVATAALATSRRARHGARLNGEARACVAQLRAASSSVLMMTVIGCTSASKASSTRPSAVSSASSIAPSATRGSLIEFAPLIGSPGSFSLGGAVLGTKEGGAGRGVVFRMGGRPAPTSAPAAAPAAAALEEADAVALAAAPSLPEVGAVLVGAVLVVRSASLTAIARTRLVTTPCRLCRAVSPRSNAAREASAPVGNRAQLW